MISKANRYARGTVWWCKDPVLSYNESVGSVQKGRRPALIISNDDRGSASIVEVLKLTTADKSNICTKINIPVFYDGKTTYILCNQHFTVSVRDLEDFMFVIPTDVMMKVENALLITQGMEHLVELQENYNNLKAIVEKIADERLLKYQKPSEDLVIQNIIADVVSSLNKTLLDAERVFNEASEKSYNHTASISTSDYSDQHHGTTDAKTPIPSNSEECSEKKRKNSRGFWTLDRIKEFVHDKETLPLTDVRNKWNMSSNSTVCSMYCQFKAKIDRIEESAKETSK